MQDRITQHTTLLTVIFLLIVSLFPLVVAYRYPIYLNDDSYITLTYSKNLANGNGFVFNHPPAVLGTTTPLLTLVLAGLAVILPQVNLAVIAVFATAFFWLGIMWILFLFRKEWGLENWQVCTLSAVVIASGWIAFLGMEAYLFAFLLVLSLSLFLGERYALTGLTSGLLFLTRGEGVLLCVVLLVATVIQQYAAKKPIDKQLALNLLRIAGGFLLPVLLWAVYAQFTFGSILPNTLAAKQAQGQSGSWNSFSHRLINEWIPLWGRPFRIANLPILNVWWIILLIGLIDVVLQRRKWLLLIGWIALYIAGYTLLNVSAYWWYQLPILFVANILFGLGLVKIVEILTKQIKPCYISIGISLTLIASSLFVLAKPTVNAAFTYQGDSRGESLTALSQWFRQNTDASDSIAYIEIGYLGYYTDNRIIDLAGLVLPDITPHVAEEDFAWGFWQYEPDYYVYLSSFDWALGDIMTDPRFGQEYQPVVTSPGPAGVDYVIYERIN